MNSMVSNRWLYCRCKPVEMSSDVPITSKWEDTCWVKYHSSSPCIKQGKGSPFLVCGGDPLKSLHRHDPPYDSGINSKPACWGGVELTLTWVVSFWPFIVMCHYRIDPHLGDTDINPHTNNIAMTISFLGVVLVCTFPWEVDFFPSLFYSCPPYVVSILS